MLLSDENGEPLVDPVNQDNSFRNCASEILLCAIIVGICVQMGITVASTNIPSLINSENPYALQGNHHVCMHYFKHDKKW